MSEQLIQKRIYAGSSDYLGAFGVASVFSFVGFLGLIFLLTDINFIGLKWWGYYLFIPAFFIWIGGIASYIRQSRLKREALAALDSYQDSTVNIETLMQDLMIDRPGLLRLLIDLRTDRQIKFKVDSKTGDIILGETFTPPTLITDVAEESTAETIYCPQCGIQMTANSLFCPNCGVSIR
ncbi:MAG: zinc-ribbon domain-containing protein [Promethearchaeota archaeon]